MKALLIPVLLMLNIQPAPPVAPAKVAAFPQMQFEKPEFLKLYVERLRLQNGTTEQNLIDFMSVAVAMQQLNINPTQLGTSELELVALLRKITLSYVIAAIQKLEKPDINALDKKIAEGEVSDCIQLYGLTAKELGITEEKKKSLILKK